MRNATGQILNWLSTKSKDWRHEHYLTKMSRFKYAAQVANILLSLILAIHYGYGVRTYLKMGEIERKSLDYYMDAAFSMGFSSVESYKLYEQAFAVAKEAHLKKLLTGIECPPNEPYCHLCPLTRECWKIEEFSEIRLPEIDNPNDLAFLQPDYQWPW